MATWMEVQLLNSREPALINIELIQFVRKSPRSDDATEILFAGDDSVDVAESYQRVRDTLKARSNA